MPTTFWPLKKPHPHKYKWGVTNPNQPTQNMIPMARNGWSEEKIIEVGKPYRARVRVSGKSCYEARVFSLG
jgi:hypothetical protein